jgi:hypothetical protein
MSDIPERDWRVFRELREVALERFCERVLREIGDIASATDSSWHQRYGNVFGLIERRDRELAHAFDGPSRSRAIDQLAEIHSHGLLTEEELGRFTPETRERLVVLSDARRGASNSRWNGRAIGGVGISSGVTARRSPKR